MNKISLVFLDFGGVIAEEGFKQGIKELAAMHAYDPELLKKEAFDLVYDSGFTSGRITSDEFWELFRLKTNINGSNRDLTNFILERFVVRSEMIEFVKKMKKLGLIVAILSDQTNWIDELDKKYDFFKYFDKIYNSYRMGITKKDSAIFDLVLDEMGGKPETTLFVDDHIHHINRAKEKGINTIFFESMDQFVKDLNMYIPDLTNPIF